MTISIVNMGQSVIRDEGQFACALRALDRRDFAAAELAFSQLLADARFNAKDRAVLLNKRGVARIGLERRGEARVDFKEALALDAGHAPALTNLANLSLEEGDVETAIAGYERAIAVDPEYAIAHLNLGVAYKRAGRVAEGVRALRHAQRLEVRANAARSWQQARRR
ncbi:MAG: tetratricopeptide repeat protein [Candidatus Eremiobacteraeota bacterium]|nr:tetratricopeptide repeat protein [Candidatus Eremiobacteraeota bacterium]